MAFKLLKLPCYLNPIHPNLSILPKKSSICTQKFSNNIQCSINEQHLHSTSNRRSANYKPSIWSHDFLQALPMHNAGALEEQKAKKLELEVRCLIKNEREEMLTRLELIDDIQRMGMRHIFEVEIREALDTIVNELSGDIKSSQSLHFTALLFRLARQHGYDVSQDVFKSFMGDKEEQLKMDLKGILSLYEASFFSIEGEELLDKARRQTVLHLNDLKKIISKRQTVENIDHAIELPLNRRMVMLEARWHIESYSKRLDKNRPLLELAKLNFNFSQSLLQTELKQMSSWWNNLELAHNLRFSRDRLMECFFWAVGIMFEPQSSSCRKVLTKIASFVTTIDDVYDVYGTLDELHLFTQAIERWDVNAVKDMPGYMKLCYMSLYNTVNEIAYDTLKQHQQYVLPYLTKAWGDLCKAFMREAKWSHNQTLPSFDEYIENGWISVSGIVFLFHAYFSGDQQSHSSQGIDCLQNHHDLLRCSSLIFRLCNDLATSSDEIERGEVVNAISCYMNENGASEEEARKHINEMIDRAWKKMNALYKRRESPFPASFVETAINLARIAHCTYQHGDGHGSPDSASINTVSLLIIQPIS